MQKTHFFLEVMNDWLSDSDIAIAGGDCVHLDLSRVRCARYVIVPNFEFRPSFEMHLISDTDTAMVSFILKNPYVRGELDETAISRYIAFAEKHQQMHPLLVELHLKEPVSRHTAKTRFENFPGSNA